jgi:hypothetical protein
MWGWNGKHCQSTIDHNTTFISYERIEKNIANFKILCNGVNVGIKATQAHWSDFKYSIFQKIWNILIT